MRLTDSAWVPTDHDTFILEISGYAKDRLMKHLTRIDKLEMKLKMMEISFEQINNSRNDLLRQLANTEKIIEDAIEYAETIVSVYEPKIIRILKGEQ